MAEYAKPWLSVDAQIDRLAGHGVEIEDRVRAASVLQAVGYYRLTGYLYPFRKSEQQVGDEGRARMRVLSGYRAGTTFAARRGHHRLRPAAAHAGHGRRRAHRGRCPHADRLRARQEVPFAYEDPTCFTEAFTAESTDARDPAPSRHVQWLQRVNDRKASSDEQFVEHFRTKYNDRMPVWALTEILELGHLSVLYRGMHQQDAEEIALAYGVPTKKILTSWLASLNYVRNVAAHHSRLFNRKLQNAPSLPKVEQITVLDHLRNEETAKGVFGTYNALAIIAYVLAAIDPGTDWAKRLAALLREFPTSHALTIESMGAPRNWESLDLWRR